MDLKSRYMPVLKIGFFHGSLTDRSFVVFPYFFVRSSLVLGKVLVFASMRELDNASQDKPCISTSSQEIT